MIALFEFMSIQDLQRDFYTLFFGIHLDDPFALLPPRKYETPKKVTAAAPSNEILFKRKSRTPKFQLNVVKKVFWENDDIIGIIHSPAAKMSRPFSRMKMKLWNLSDDDVPVKKTKKYKSKEEKEIKKTFENIAKKLLAKGLESIREEVEVQIRDSLNRSSSEIRHEVATIESTFSSRLLNLETKMNSLSSRIEETHNENSRKVDQIRQDLTTLTAQATQQIETERAKRLSTAKKLQEKFEQQIEAVQNNISTSKHDATATANALNEDLRLQVKEILGLKEKVDEM